MLDNLIRYYKKFRSDKRIKGGVWGYCCLCERQQRLILSHIAPKWAYYWMKREGAGSIVGSYESIGVRVNEQDGSKHYILCQACDQSLGDAENYVKKIMHGYDREKKELGITIDDELYQNLNFTLVQRFMFGMVLKAHFASSAPFHNILLKNEQISEIRIRINNPSLEDEEYPIIAMKFESGIVKEVDPKAIFIPLQTNENNREAISFLIAGWEWVVFFNKDKWVNNSMFFKLRLCKDGIMKIYKGEILDQRFINRGKFLSRNEKHKLKRRNM